MKKAERKYIRQNIEWKIIVDDILIEKLIQELQNIKETYEGKGIKNITLYQPYDDSGNVMCPTLLGERLETDEEYDERLELEKRYLKLYKRQKEDKKINERKEYERLKKKYEQK